MRHLGGVKVKSKGRDGGCKSYDEECLRWFFPIPRGRAAELGDHLMSFGVAAVAAILFTCQLITPLGDQLPQYFSLALTAAIASVQVGRVQVGPWWCGRGGCNSYEWLLYWEVKME